VGCNVFGIIVLIVVNLFIGYALALYRYQPDRLPIPWDWLPQRLMQVSRQVSKPALH
jgi:hypothetical protein